MNNFDPEFANGLERLVAKLRPHGMRLFQQLWHGGHNVRRQDGAPPWSASDVPSPYFGIVPVPMTQAMIDDVVNGFAATARTARLAGLDGVEIHAAHGYLVQQFLSSVTNRRPDGYGGPLGSRMRFLLEAYARFGLRPVPALRWAYASLRLCRRRRRCRR